MFNEEYFADKIDCFKLETPNHLLPYTQGVNEWIGLFFVGGNRLADGESTSPRCPNDPKGHSNEENDLMLPIVPAILNPILTQKEVEKALHSPKAFYFQD
ncbi:MULTISPECIES: hypothetical protein [Bacillus cereus group]|uniref:hypothetical protein n=1 Tax=Bacillus cereus group TaxID=86661 RepID=UPI001F0A7E38|nr:hypothetical protein [Bacillus cereus]